MSELTTLDEQYSTTRLVRKVEPGLVMAEIKAAHKPEDKFETVLFLPEGESRQGEGGLRTQGYFKQSEEGKPLITVVTVVYNGEKFLEETILSVINQTYDNVEYIIIDGGSTDGTLDIIKKYEHAIDYWVSENDKGIYDAMNKGVKLSYGSFICVLNADDYYNVGIFNEFFQSFQSQCYDFTVGKVYLVDSKNVQKGIMNPLEDMSYGYRQYKKMPTPHMSFFLRTSIFKKIGLFDTKVGLSADYDLVLRVLSETQNFYRFKEFVGSFRDGGASSVYFRSFFNTYKVHKKHGLVLTKRLLIFFTSLAKVYLLKVMPTRVGNYIVSKFGSGRFIIK